MDLYQFEDNFVKPKESKPEQVPTIANSTHFVVAIQDIEFSSFENSFVLSCDFD